MNRRNLLLGLYLLAALLGGIFLWYFKQGIPDISEIEQRSDDLFLTIQADNANINEAVLRSRQNIDTSYDYLNSQLVELREDMHDLQTTLAKIDNPLLAERLTQLDQQITDKISLIENFKSTNSTVRNPLRYLPIVSYNLAQEAVTEKLDDLALKYAAVSNAMQHYSLTGAEDDKVAFANLLSDVDNASKALSKSPEIERKQIELQTHGNVILAMLDQLNQTIESIITQKESGINNVADALQSWTNIQNNKQNKYNQYLIAYSIYLIIGLAFVLWWLRGLYRTLDQRVIERTEELKRTYEELQKSQLYLIQSEKMAMLGQMVAGVAHEVNTPLGYVKNNVTLLQDLNTEYNSLVENILALDKQDVDQKEILSNIRKQAHNIKQDGIEEEQEQIFSDTLFGVEQIAELVVNLRNFARLDEEKVKKVDMRQCINTSLNISRNNTKHLNIEKRYEGKEIPEIECSPAQINQVLLNLFNNAAQAMPDREGRLIIDLNQNGEFLQIDVGDNGSGMDEVTRAKIFEPFFTTKPAGVGTGLGLPICKQIIEAHGGTIKVDSKIGKGTLFRILLPITREVAQESINH